MLTLQQVIDHTRRRVVIGQKKPPTIRFTCCHKTIVLGNEMGVNMKMGGGHLKLPARPNGDHQEGGFSHNQFKAQKDSTLMSAVIYPGLKNQPSKSDPG